MESVPVWRFGKASWWPYLLSPQNAPCFLITVTRRHPNWGSTILFTLRASCYQNGKFTSKGRELKSFSVGLVLGSELWRHKTRVTSPNDVWRFQCEKVKTIMTTCAQRNDASALLSGWNLSVLFRSRFWLCTQGIVVRAWARHGLWQCGFI